MMMMADVTLYRYLSVNVGGHMIRFSGTALGVARG